MKFRKGLSILMAVGLAMTTAAPCAGAEASGEVTADSLIEGYLQKNEEFRSVSGKERIAMDLEMAIFGQEMSMKMDMLLDIESTKDISHASGDMTMIQTGTSEEDNMEETMETDIYSQMEDDNTFTVYTLDADSNTWSKSNVEIQQFNMDLKNLVKGDDFELSEGTVDVDGKTCYEVRGVMALADMMEYIGNSMEGLGDILPVGGEEDADAYKMDVFYYFDTESRDLTSLKMDGAGMLETLFMDALAKSFEEMESEGSSSEEEDSFDMSELLSMFQIEIPEFAVEVSNIEFDTVETIEIPAEALAAELAA